MPQDTIRKPVTLTVGETRAEVEPGTRLVLAIESLGIEIGHRCGGKARCATCRVRFTAGEPKTMTEAEYRKLEEKGLLGEVRLSCQILCENDLAVRVLRRFSESGLSDPGPRPHEDIDSPEHA